MKLLLILSILATSLTFADTISLNVGESIYIADKHIKCVGNSNNDDNGYYSDYADMPLGRLKSLLRVGFGTCKIKTTSGSNKEDFYYSNNFNGLHVNRSTISMIRNDIRNGGCE